MNDYQAARLARAAGKYAFIDPKEAMEQERKEAEVLRAMGIDITNLSRPYTHSFESPEGAALFWRDRYGERLIENRRIDRMQVKVASFMAGGCIAIFLLAVATVLL